MELTGIYRVESTGPSVLTEESLPPEHIYSTHIVKRLNLLNIADQYADLNAGYVAVVI